MRFRNSALHAAADTGNAKLAQRLIADRADLFAVGKGGWQPLLMAVYKGHAPVVRVLLEAGAGRDESQRPLHVAAEYGYLEIVRLLIDDGLTLNSLDDRRRTPLDLAADQATAALLRERGALPGDQVAADRIAGERE